MIDFKNGLKEVIDESNREPELIFGHELFPNWKSTRVPKPDRMIID